ncbi:MAG: DUF6282 family protein [Candidatus Acidiferrales bacterium]|jgi:hypothetical protein
MLSRFSRVLTKQLRWAWIGLFLFAVPALGQEINLNGAIDFHVHSSPDGVPRSIDADDLARLAKQNGMRGLVLKNHHESTAALAYMVRKEVPGIEIFGGITQDLSVGGINVEAVRQMTLMKGGWGRVVWLPTFDAENAVKRAGGTGPFVPVSKDGHLLPGVLELIDFIAQHHDMVLETGHVSAEEGLMVIHEAHQRGVAHLIVTHATNLVVDMTIPQMQQAARDGAFIELDAGGPLGAKPMHTYEYYANAIRQVGAKSCILVTDFGSVSDPTRPLHPQGLLNFMNALHAQGISVNDLNTMTKTNPALALGLPL